MREEDPKPQRPDGEMPRLTPRELEVLKLAEEGLTDREIAERLFICTKTVNHHMEHLREKFGVHTRLSLILAFKREHLRKDG